MTTVTKVDRKTNNFTLYIGRAFAGLPASKWMNRHYINGPHPEDRDECLAKYEADVRANPNLMASLSEIDDQVLGCWCHDHETPSDGTRLYCHGDVLIKLRKEQLQCQSQKI